MAVPAVVPEDRLPLFIGVTGHRDLLDQDRPRLCAAVRQVLLTLVNEHPGSPLVILTALAEGADRLVARVAAEMSIPYLAVLPMPSDAYAVDFAEPGSAGELRSLLDGALGSPIELPLPEGVSAADLLDNELGSRHRHAQYEALRDWLVRHSQVLLALWDGVHGDSTVGTSGLVRAALTGRPERHRRDALLTDAIDLCPVIHLPAERASTGKPSPVQIVPRILTPARPMDVASPEVTGVRSKRVSSEAILFLDDLNRDLARAAPDGHASRELWSDPPALTSTEQRLEAWHERISALSAREQRRRHSIFMTIVLLSVSAFAFLELYAHVWIHSPWLLLAFPLFLIAAVGWLRVVRQRGDHERHLDYRALAEALRVSFYWTVAGVTADVAAQYPTQQATELDPIRSVARSIQLWSRAGQPPGVAPTEATTARIHSVRERWVVGQAVWLEDAARRLDSTARRANWIVLGLWVGGAGWAVLLAFAQLAGLFEEGSEVHHASILAMTLALALGAAVKLHTERKALHETVGQYARLAPIFRAAAERLTRLSSIGDDGAARTVFLTLGREALAENGAWTILHRGRKPEVHAGG